MKVKQSIDLLMQNIGYTFKDFKLCDLALTHRSLSAKNNERLELLGDSILNAIITSELYKRLPTAPEGYLTRLRSKLVREEFLASIAQFFKLGDSICLGKGERKSGGNMRSSILADALEAMIGAIYCDSDFSSVQSCVISWYKDHLEHIDIENVVIKDPKTRLQELLQNKGLNIPEYKLTKITGKLHTQMFHVMVIVSQLNKEALGIGTSKRKAEQEAAKLLLEEFHD